MLTSYKNEIDEAIASCLAEYKDLPELYAPVDYLFEGGGKRIRPILTLLACEVIGGDRQHALSASVAVELLHNFTLVHDDIMDRSPLRRGRKTVHMRYDENTAILSGDVMMGMALRMVERSAKHAANPIDVISAFSTGLVDVCEGQAMDMAFTDRSDVTTEEYFTMIEKKTAKLLEMSVRIGGLVGGGTPEQVEELRVFSRAIGIAFQLQDDLLDLIGSEEFGKAAGGDIVEGKRTWMVLRTRDLATQRAGEFGECVSVSNEFFENGGLPRERVPEMVNCMKTLGVLDEVEELIQSTTDEAYKHLHTLPPSDARDSLEALASKLVVRTH